jgi:anaerobic selenocysteine-containing dehydrogenase
VVAPLYDTQHLGDSVIQIANALKGSVRDSFRWENYQACLKQTLGNQWPEMNTSGYWAAPTAAASPQSGFTTPSGKLVLMNDPMKKIFGSVLSAPAGDERQFPFLLTDYDTIRLSSGYIGNPPFMNKVLPDTVLKGNDGFVELNPETAQRLGLSEGQSAMLTTPLGQAKVRVHLNHGIMPDLLAMASGLGHWAYDAFLAGKGVNIHQLIAPVDDPASGLDAAWGIRASLAKA